MGKGEGEGGRVDGVLAAPAQSFIAPFNSLRESGKKEGRGKRMERVVERSYFLKKGVSVWRWRGGREEGKRKGEEPDCDDSLYAVITGL